MLERKLVDSIVHKGRKIEARLLGPDLLGYIDGVEMPHMYMRTQDLFNLAKTQIDEVEAEKDKLIKAAGGGAKKKGAKK